MGNSDFGWIGMSKSKKPEFGTFVCFGGDGCYRTKLSEIILITFLFRSLLRFN